MASRYILLKTSVYRFCPVLLYLKATDSCTFVSLEVRTFLHYMLALPEISVTLLALAHYARASFGERLTP